MTDARAVGLRAPWRVVVPRDVPHETDHSRDPDALYRRLAPAVLGYLRAQGAVDPEDLLMDVFVAVVRDLPRISGDDDSLRRWVFTIAHHRIVDERRRRGRRSRMSEAEAARHLDGATPDAMPSGPDPALVAALADLTPAQRDVIGLRVVADLSVDDVARIMHRRPDAVKALHHRALTRLAERLR